MLTNDFTHSKCKPCEGGVPPLSASEVAQALLRLDGWNACDSHHIEKEWTLKDFAAVLEAVNRIARLAEDEGHHPDILIHQYRKLRITLWTHAVGGLSENDFIMAAKIDALCFDGRC